MGTEKGIEKDIREIFPLERILQLKTKTTATIQGTKALIEKVSIGGSPLYIIKRYEKYPERYELEKTVLLSIQKSELEEILNGKKIRVMPKLESYDDENKWFLFRYFPYKDARENLKKAHSLGEKFNILYDSLTSLACLHFRLNQHKEDILNKVEIKKVYNQELVEKILSYLESVYDTKRYDWPFLKGLKNSLKEAVKPLDSSDYLIHGAYYASHVKLNKKEIINLDLGNVKRGPLEVDIGCFLGDVYSYFKDEPIDLIATSKKIYQEGLKNLEKKHNYRLNCQLREELISIGMIYGALRKAAGIISRKRKWEFEEVEPLKETAELQIKKLAKSSEWKEVYRDIEEKIRMLKNNEFSFEKSEASSQLK